MEMVKPDQRHEFIIVDGPPTGVARGFQMGLICLLFGGIPAAITAAVLTKTASAEEWHGCCAKIRIRSGTSC